MTNPNNANPSGAGIAWQPVFMAPTKIGYNITGKRLISIRVFSIVSIISGILSIGLQIPALVIYATSIYNYVYYPFDVVGHGIWCGSFYVTAGSLGAAACNKKTQSLLVGTVVMSALSIAGSIVATTLSAITAGSGVSYRCYYEGYYYELCDAWLGLEWSLMTVSILAFISSITLVVVASVPLCCGRRNQGSNKTTKVTVGSGNNQQPMYYQPQPMCVAAQQQQQPNVQFAYTGQQTQYPQQVLYPQLQEPQFSQPTSNLQVASAHHQQQQYQSQQQPPALVHQQYPQLPQQAPVVHEEKSQQNKFSQPEQLKVE